VASVFLAFDEFMRCGAGLKTGGLVARTPNSIPFEKSGHIENHPH
jgi:hypothetical protein